MPPGSVTIRETYPRLRAVCFSFYDYINTQTLKDLNAHREIVYTVEEEGNLLEYSLLK